MTIRYSRSVRVLVTTLVLVGCYHPNASYQSCAIECTSSCPPGYTCDHGRCRANDSASSCLLFDAPGSEPMPDDVPSDMQPNACPLSYNLSFNASPTRYRFVMELKDWPAAAADCADDLTGAPFHTHLVVVTTDSELSGVDAFNSGTTSWLGLSDRKMPGAFLWVTNESTSYPPASGSPWETNEPNMGAGFDCVENRVADLRTEMCATPRAYYCECDMLANDPTRY